MPIFPVPSGRFAGMTQDQLLTVRAAAQAALITLGTGGRVQSASYSQGDGSKTVNFQAMSEMQIARFIAQLNAALGVERRRAIGVYFR